MGTIHDGDGAKHHNYFDDRETLKSLKSITRMHH